MMTPRRVRRQDPELQFADEPVRHPVAAGSPASRGPEIRRHHLRARGKLVPEEPCVQPELSAVHPAKCSTPYKRQPPDLAERGLCAIRVGGGT